MEVLKVILGIGILVTMAVALSGGAAAPFAFLALLFFVMALAVVFAIGATGAAARFLGRNWRGE